MVVFYPGAIIMPRFENREREWKRAPRRNTKIPFFRPSLSVHTYTRIIKRERGEKVGYKGKDGCRIFRRVLFLPLPPETEKSINVYTRQKKVVDLLSSLYIPRFSLHTRDSFSSSSSLGLESRSTSLIISVLLSTFPTFPGTAHNDLFRGCTRNPRSVSPTCDSALRQKSQTARQMMDSNLFSSQRHFSWWKGKPTNRRNHLLLVPGSEWPILGSKWFLKLRTM